MSITVSAIYKPQNSFIYCYRNSKRHTEMSWRKTFHSNSCAYQKKPLNKLHARKASYVPCWIYMSTGIIKNCNFSMHAWLCILQFINQPSGWLIVPDGIISVCTWLATSVTILILIFVCSKGVWGGRVSNSQAPPLKRPIADGNNLMSCDSRYINMNVNSQHSSGEMLNKITTFKNLLISLWECCSGVVGWLMTMLRGGRGKKGHVSKFTLMMNL